MDIIEIGGIVGYVNLSGNESCIRTIYTKWQDILKELSINFDLRNDPAVDKWFLECYRYREELDAGDIGGHTKRDELFQQFINIVDDRIGEKTGVDEIFWVNERTKVRDLKASKEKCWIETAASCVAKEMDVIENSEEIAPVEDATEMPPVDIEVRLYSLKAELNGGLVKCQEESQTIRDLEQKTDEYQRLEEQLRQSIGSKGIIGGNEVVLGPSHVNSVTLELERIRRQKEICGGNLKSKAESVNSMFEQIKTFLGEVVDQLEAKVRSWQRDFQLKYAGLYATPDLDRLGKTCASVGQFLHNLQREELVDCEQYLDAEVVRDIQENLVDLQVKLFQKTFVVTDQDDFIFKFKRKKQPKIVVRILAADSLTELRTSEVKAFLVFENDLNNCYHDNDLDLARIEREYKNFTIKTSKVKLKKSKDEEMLEGVFDALEMAENFKRPESSVDQKQVHECRYNIVFVAEVNVGESKRKFWTLSPPVVLTSGANQGCMAHASIMWRCFSLKDRVGQLPFPDTENMPWSSIVEMLDLYIRTLSPERGLTPENKHHLKRRLLGGSNKPDDYLVTMKSFCYGKLEKYDPTQKNTPSNSFSFWTWMEANYNLIRKHLLPYWEKGWIHGFLSNEDAVSMLKRVRPVSGMFILRFSDYSIQPSQGMNSSLGFLTACISRMKTTPDGRQHVKIVHYSVTGHGAIKTSTLKQILKECIDKKHGPVYRVLYPGPLTREETFDAISDDDSSAEKCTSDTLGSYHKFDVKRVTDLDEEFSALDIDTGKHTASALDHSTEDCGEMGIGMKRLRTDDASLDEMVRSPGQMSTRSYQSSAGGWSPASQWEERGTPLSIQEEADALTQQQQQLLLGSVPMDVIIEESNPMLSEASLALALPTSQQMPMMTIVGGDPSSLFVGHDANASKTAIPDPSSDVPSTMTVHEKVQMLYTLFTNIPLENQTEVAHWCLQQVTDDPILQRTVSIDSNHPLLVDLENLSAQDLDTQFALQENH